MSNFHFQIGKGQDAGASGGDGTIYARLVLLFLLHSWVYIARLVLH